MNQKSRQSSPLNIFLSYAKSDASYGSTLQRLLFHRPNVRIFAPEMLSAGEDWQAKLKEELSKCDIFLLILTPNSFDSKWVLQELGAAWALNKPIIVIGTNIQLLSKIPVDLSQNRFVLIDELENPEILDQILEHFGKIESTIS